MAEKRSFLCRKTDTYLGMVFVDQVNVVHSVGYFRDAINISMLHDNISVMKTLCLELFGSKTGKRIAMTSSMLSQQHTGTYVITVTTYRLWLS